MEAEDAISQFTSKVGISSNFEKIKTKNITLRGPLSDEVDWVQRGHNLPVQFQDECRSCYSFGAISTLEAAFFIKYHKNIKLSEQFGLDCSINLGNNGCDGGYVEYVYDLAIKYGIGFYEDFPYKNNKSECHLIHNKNYIKIRDYFKVPEGNEEELKKVVATVGPVTVGVHSNFTEFLHFKGGDIFDDPNCSSEQDDGDHIMVLVGYGTTPEGKDYWLLKNSWGSNWGDNGYMKMARDKNKCGIANYVLYPDDPYIVSY